MNKKTEKSKGDAVGKTVREVAEEVLCRLNGLFNLTYHMSTSHSGKESMVDIFEIGLALVRDGRRQISEMDDYAQEHCGNIVIDVMSDERLVYPQSKEDYIGVRYEGLKLG